MRHYVKCVNCKKIFYLSTKAKKRSELPSTFNLTCTFCQYITYYYPIDVFAESAKNTGAAGALVGGLIGLAAGGVGAIVGAAIGAALAGSQDKIEKDLAKGFNES